MSFSALEFMLARQRGRQWVSLSTQQFRLRHVYQIIGYNLTRETTGSYYFTLHLTTLSAPFYTSEQLKFPRLKWDELNQRDMPNGSASCVVLRIWKHNDEGADKIVLTWGVHFSGLCYLGNKIVDIQPRYFKDFTVIFCMQGGYYTSHKLIRTDLQKPIPFISNVNLVDTNIGKAVYKPVEIRVSRHEVQNSYNLEKLRKIHNLQIQIQKKTVDVQNIEDKINLLSGFNVSTETESQTLQSEATGASSSIRYAPQMLTMNSLNKMLKGKPTILQKQKMLAINKEIEKAKFLVRLLSQEKDKQSVIIRGRKQKFLEISEDNEERESNLMEDYRKLSKSAEKLKEYKKLIYQHREMYSNINMNLQQRRRQLLNELLAIFPIEKKSEDQYKILGIHLPKSDVLSDSADAGVPVALGYITHILIRAATFLQLPLRYPLVHYGSRSFIIDNISPTVPDKDRHFPLFTRGKDRVQFTYAVYLLNKDLAQLRWYLGMNTTDLKATLHNLLTFLEGAREPRPSSAPHLHELRSPTAALPRESRPPTAPLPQVPPDGKFVSLQRFGSTQNISDPILDCIRREKAIERSSSPTTTTAAGKPAKKACRNSECGGKGLSEILTVPEAYLENRMTGESFRSYVSDGKMKTARDGGGDCCGTETSAISTNESANLIKIANGKELARPLEKSDQFNNVEQGTDALASPTKVPKPNVTSKTIEIRSDGQPCQKTAVEDAKPNKRISRSVGSYTDDEEPEFTLKRSLELGSEPVLSVRSERVVECKPAEISQKHTFGGILEELLGGTPGDTLSKTEVAAEIHLMARTDALLTTKSFNLIRPKQ